MIIIHPEPIRCYLCGHPMHPFDTVDTFGDDRSDQKYGRCAACAAKLEAEIEEQVSDEAALEMEREDAKTDFDHAPQACPVMRWHNKGGTK